MSNKEFKKDEILARLRDVAKTNDYHFTTNAKAGSDSFTIELLNGSTTLDTFYFNWNKKTFNFDLLNSKIKTVITKDNIHLYYEFMMEDAKDIVTLYDSCDDTLISIDKKDVSSIEADFLKRYEEYLQYDKHIGEFEHIFSIQDALRDNIIVFTKDNIAEIKASSEYKEFLTFHNSDNFTENEVNIKACAVC